MLARPVWQILRRAEKIEALTLLVAENMSASAMAAQFEGVTRNAILGFCARHGVTMPNSRPGPTPKRAVKQKPRRARPRPPKPVGNRASVVLDLPPEPDTATAVLFAEALDRRLCKWPLWSTFGPDAKCCGAPRADTGPYCAHHAHRAVQRVSPL